MIATLLKIGGGMFNRGEKMRGQLSAEMLILLALVLGLLLVAYTYMSGSMDKAGKQIDQRADRVFIESTTCSLENSSPCDQFGNAHCDFDLKHCVMDN